VLKRKISDASDAGRTADDRAARSAVEEDPGGPRNDSASSAIAVCAVLTAAPAHLTYPDA
jgi:hypothetical protein